MEATNHYNRFDLQLFSTLSVYKICIHRKEEMQKTYVVVNGVVVSKEEFNKIKEDRVETR